MKSEIQRVIFSREKPFQIEVVNLSSLLSNLRGTLSKPHRTDFYHLFLNTTSTPAHSVDFETVVLKKNSVLAVDKEQIHKFDKKAAYRGKVLIFTDRFLAGTGEDIPLLKSGELFNPSDGNPMFTPTNEEFTKLYELVSFIENESREPGDNLTNLLLSELLKTTIIYAERIKSKSVSAGGNISLRSSVIVKFKRLTEEHYKSNYPVKWYAEQLHISEKKLTALCINNTGKTPKEVLNERVLLEAKRLLVYTTQSVKEIGFMLGFTEPTNFVKYFKKYTAQTPGEFREEQLG